jgi:hypothetical protein
MFKTGDKHPVFNLAAFVEYDEQGREVWTSICEDSGAPYRLANLYAQRRHENKKKAVHNVGNPTSSLPDQRPCHIP